MNLSNIKIYNNNIKTLQKCYPTFKNDILDKYSENPKIVFTESQNGLTTAKIDNIFIHSSRQPDKEAEKLVRNGIKDHEGLCIIFGFGLGYHIEAFIKEYPQMKILVIEPEPDLFISVCKIRNISEIIESEQTGFLFDTPAETIISILNSFNTIKIQIFKLRSLYLRNEKYYKEVENVIRGFIVKKETNNNTLNRFGKIWIKNLFKNIDFFRKASDCGVWFEKFKKWPALVIAAGPSLDSILPMLPKLYKRMIIICVDTALKTITERGVVPDFVVVVDPQYLNSRHVDGLLSVKDLQKNSVLISESSTHPSVFRNCLLPVYFFKSMFPLGKIFDDYAGISSAIGAGGSVATTAWDFARLLGCSQIYSAGLDLGYPGKNMHCRNSLSFFITCLKSNRLKPMETINFNEIYSTNPYYEKNNQNEKTLTDKRLTIYSWWFKSQIEAFKRIKAYNFSKYGIKIKGMNFVKVDNIGKLKEVRIEIEKLKQEIKDGTSVEKIKNISQIVIELLNECKKISKLCKEALISIDVLKKTKIQSKIDKEIAALSHIDKQIAESSYKEIIEFIIQPVFAEVTYKGGSAFENSQKRYNQLLESSNFHISCAEKALLHMYNSN